MNHSEVKSHLIEQGKQRGLKGGDLRVLSTDPFFVGSERDYVDAKWAAPLWEKMMARRRKPLHLRGFHYWIQSQGIPKPDGEKYAHGADPARDWGYLLHCAQIARYLGIGKWTGLLDLKHPDPSDFDNYRVSSGLESDGSVDIQQELNIKLEGLVQEFVNRILREAPEYSTNFYQTFHHEVWCEKNSMGAFLEPACRKFGATYQPLVGQASVAKVSMACDRAIRAVNAGKKVRVWYISDFDRYGWQMVSAVARKLEFMLHQQGVQGADIKLTRLALSEEQIEKFNLPKAPKHGEAVVELDALEAIHPGELGKLVEAALRPYHDSEKPRIVAEENRRIRGVVQQMVDSQLRPGLVEALKGIDMSQIADGFDMAEAIDPNFIPPEPGKEVVEDDSWMYDSQLPYWQQWEKYRSYKASRKEESIE